MQGMNRDADVENRCGGVRWRKRDWDELGGWDGHVYTIMCMDMYTLPCV